MKRTIIIMALALIVSAAMLNDTAAAADGRGEPLRLMRRPDIHGGTIVFAWQGDLWSVPADGGTAKRLTVHVGIEDHPKFSPDGTMIALRGDYNERRNSLFVMPAGGGRRSPLGSPRHRSMHESAQLKHMQEKYTHKGGPIFHCLNVS